MVVSLVVATFFTFWYPILIPTDPSLWWELGGSILPVAITTAAWILAAFLTKPTEPAVLKSFYRKVRPGGPGWKAVRELLNDEGLRDDETRADWDVPLGLVCTLLGCLTVYGAIFSTGYWIYGRTVAALSFSIPTLILATLLGLTWKQLRTGPSR